MTTTNKKHYRRIVLKLSGESLIGKSGFGISVEVIEDIAKDIKKLVSNGIQVGIVVGGGNFFRGAKLGENKISRITGDHLGMLATILNALVMRDVFAHFEIPTVVMSALPVSGVVRGYDSQDANELLKRGNVIIFAGGTGNPLVTTDTALCLRGIEVGADLLMKATNVKGVYDSDPKTNPNTKIFTRLTYTEALARNLAVMDQAAFLLARDHNMKIRVFNIFEKGAILKVASGEDVGTLIESA